LNCLLVASDKAEKLSDAVIKDAPLAKNSEELWAQIAEDASRRFGVTLALALPAIPAKFARLGLLRGIARKTGLQLLARDYNFEKGGFQTSDVVAVVPIIKHAVTGVRIFFFFFPWKLGFFSNLFFFFLLLFSFFLPSSTLPRRLSTLRAVQGSKETSSLPLICTRKPSRCTTRLPG
jgi:hypothetical protein